MSESSGTGGKADGTASRRPRGAALRQGDLEQTILEALVASGKDLARLTPDDLAPVDEFHTAGRQATVDFAGQIASRPGMHLLDIGCGIGGPSRYFAVERGCRVTGIDLTEDYVRTAEALSRRVGLDGQSRLPAGERACPAVRGRHVRRRLHDACRHEHRGQAEAFRRSPPRAEERRQVRHLRRHADRRRRARFPVHWAASAETSFVASPAEYRRGLEAAGFASSRSATAATSRARFFARGSARQGGRGRRTAAPRHAHPDEARRRREKIANVMANIKKGLIAPTELICRAA